MEDFFPKFTDFKVSLEGELKFEQKSFEKFHKFRTFLRTSKTWFYKLPAARFSPKNWIFLIKVLKIFKKKPFKIFKKFQIVEKY